MRRYTYLYHKSDSTISLILVGIRTHVGIGDIKIEGIVRTTTIVSFSHQ
jgi:hypothetical protein